MIIQNYGMYLYMTEIFPFIIFMWYQIQLRNPQATARISITKAGPESTKI